MKARTGLWIKDHLLDVGEDSVTKMWKRRNYFAAAANNVGASIRNSKYRSFWSYVYILSAIGLIEHVRSEPGPRNPDLEEKYYAIVDSEIYNTDWENPIPKYLSLFSKSPQYRTREFVSSPRETWAMISSERTFRWNQTRERKPAGRKRRLDTAVANLPD